jgi:hypothetical protein
MGVTANQELCKQPAEKRKFGMEFAALMDTSSGEVISSIDGITSETISGGTSDLTITSPAIANGVATSSKVELWIAGGTAGLKYRIEILVTTSGGQILEGDGLLKVTDR